MAKLQNNTKVYGDLIITGGIVASNGVGSAGNTLSRNSYGQLCWGAGGGGGGSVAYVYTTTGGHCSVGIGKNTQTSTYSTYCGVAIGYKANVYSDWNSATGRISIGYRANQNSNNANCSIAIGFQAMPHHCYNSGNVAVGSNTGYYNFSGYQNTIIGSQAMSGMAGGNTRNSIAIGWGAAFGAGYWDGGEGDLNNVIVIGTGAGRNIGGGWSGQICRTILIGGVAGAGGYYDGRGMICSNMSDQIAIGYGAMQWRCSGYGGGFSGFDIAIGKDAMNKLWINGRDNIAIGKCALAQSQDNYTSNIGSIAIGRYAMKCIQHSAGYSVAIGADAMSNYGGWPDGAGGGVAIGWKAAQNSTSKYSIAIGMCAMACSTGSLDGNIAIGRCAMAFSRGMKNIGIGEGALFNNGYGDFNSNYGKYNVAVGFHAGCNNTNGGYNTFIGTNAGICNSLGVNNTFIGNGADGLYADASDTITLGNGIVSYIRANVTSITSLSDARDKKDIENLPVGLDFLRQVRPVKFKWNTRDGKRVDIPDSGFIAQELKQVQEDFSVADILGLVISNKDQSRYEATPGNLLPVIVKAIKDLADKHDALEARVVTLEAK